jgi:hypothetical protein
MRLPDRRWANTPEYQALLYFCQLVDEMVWYGTRDSYRAPSLNTYHRCDEILRSAGEIKLWRLREGILSSMFDELQTLGQRDPTVQKHFPSEWARLNFAFEKGDITTKIFAVRQFLDRISTAYLKRCRDEIQRIVKGGECKEKDRLRRLAGSLCSYILNVGHSSEQIRYALNVHFFNRELDRPPARELQNFFAEFPCRRANYDVYAFTTEELGEVVQGPGCEIIRDSLPPGIRQRHGGFLETTKDHYIIVFRAISAFDPSDARLRAEAQMALARAIAYTSRPLSSLEWKPEIIVAWSANTSGILLADAPDPLRRRYRESESYTDLILDKRKQIVFESDFDTTDRNRIMNAIIAYSNAFHSESPATQLTTVWSSLEGLLPLSANSEGRIDSITKFALPCQRAAYLKNLFQWAFTDHYALGRDEFFAIIDKIQGFRSRLSRFIAVLCFPEFKSISDELGAFAARSPLTTYRGFRLVMASQKIADLWKLLKNHEVKVDWQLHRIYRERNRIVHQASPSSNVTTLILNLNEYFLVCLDALFQVTNRAPTKSSLDDLFIQISLEQDYREQQIQSLTKEALARENAEVVLGFDLE